MLGNSRFLIIVISVLSAVALICLGASAVEPSEGLVRESPGVRSVPTDTPPASLFKTTYRFYTHSNNILSQMSPATEDNPVYCFYFYMKDISGTVITATASENVPLWIGSLPGAGALTDVHFGDEVYQIHNQNFACDIVSYSSISHYFGAYWTKVTQSPSFDLGSLFNSILGVGNKLVTFVMSSWVVLVPVVAFVCILGYGVIRRLVKGV